MDCDFTIPMATTAALLSDLPKDQSVYRAQPNLSVAETADESIAFKIYPNPSNGLFQIASKKLQLQSIEVYATSGQMVFKQSMPETIDLSGFAKGIYFAKISGDGFTETQKLILRWPFAVRVPITYS